MTRFLGPILLCLLWSPLHADEASHLRSAEELLQSMNMEDTMRKGAESMLELEIQKNPTLLPFRDVFMAWTSKVITWEAIGPEMARLYADAFTEEELREITAFYRTPTGQKTLVTFERLFGEGTRIGARLAEEHKDELQSMIRQRAEELRQANPGPGASPPGN